MTDRESKRIRLSLKKVSPATAWNVRGFIVFNIALGIGLYILAPDIHSIQSVGLLSKRLWGIVFLIHALIMLWVYIDNNWQAIKGALLAGCVIKTIWIMQLLSLAIQGGSPLIYFFIATGFMLLYLQAGSYINFTPRYKPNAKH